MDAAAKKSVLRLFSYGLYAVTAQHEGQVSAMTANWLTQVSFSPPLLALAAEGDSHTRAILEASEAFAVNIYDAEQRDMAGHLGMTWAKHPDKLNGFAWQPGPATGSPLLKEALGWVECRVVNRMPAGDHVLYLAEVVEAGLQREGTPLTLKAAGFKYAG